MDLRAWAKEKLQEALGLLGCFGIILVGVLIFSWVAKLGPPAPPEPTPDPRPSMALNLVLARNDAKYIVARHPNEEWSVASDRDNATTGYPVYCPDEYDVTYGTVDTDPDSLVFTWLVSTKLKLVRAPYTEAEFKNFAKNFSPAPAEEDRLPACLDGKPPALVNPSDLSTDNSDQGG